MQKNRHDKLVKELKQLIEDLREQLRKVKRVNNELQMDIDDARFKIAEWYVFVGLPLVRVRHAAPSGTCSCCYWYVSVTPSGTCSSGCH